ncbi:hypothetical protein [Amycolatopsis stemonae]
MDLLDGLPGYRGPDAAASEVFLAVGSSPRVRDDVETIVPRRCAAVSA